MLILGFIGGAIATLGWLYLAFARGGFWLASFKTARPLPRTFEYRVAAIVPARNEAAFVGAALTSLLRQNHSGPLHIFLIDDGSSDSTAAAAREAAQQAERNDALTVIHGAALPTGWTGKLWALQQGMQAARAFAPDFFLFTDADIAHAPATIATLLAIAERENRDLVSFMVKLECRSLAEKLLIPAFVFFFFKLYPPRWVASCGHRTAGAAGGCMMVLVSAFDRSGGLNAIRGEIIDDCALARSMKRAGSHLWLQPTQESQSLRSYGSAHEISRMVARTAFSQLGHSTGLLALTLLGMMALYVLPVALLFGRDERVVALSALACVMMLSIYLPTVRWYRLNPLWTLTLPVAAVFYCGATLRSAWNFWRGRGGEWKGRNQDLRGTECAGT